MKMPYRIRRRRRPFLAESLEVRQLLTIDYLHALNARSGVPDDGFGWSHAASDDYHVVGNPFLERQPGNEFVGEVQVHDAITGTLVRTIANPDPGDLYRFGYSVDVFENWIVVGAVGWGDVNTADTTVPGFSDRSGRAYLFEADTGNLLFTFDGTFTTGNPATENHDLFGESVSIDGNYVVIGAPGIAPFEPGGSSPSDGDAGHAYIFSRLTGSLLHVLESPEPEAAEPGAGEFDLDFGLSVATSNGKVIVGNHDTETYGDNGNIHGGKAYVYNASSGELLLTLLAPDTLQLGETTFGEEVAIDGSRVAVSTFSSSGPLTYVFGTSTGNLIQTLDNVRLADIDSGEVASGVFVSNAAPTFFGSLHHADTGDLTGTIPLPPGYDSEAPSFQSKVTLFGGRLLVGEGPLLLGDSGTVFVYDNGANAPPTDIALSANIVVELAADGTVVGALSATDPTPGETLTFSMLNTSGGRFGLSGSDLVVADGGLLNFESQSAHSVTVRVTDSAGNTFDRAFTISVTDVNEAATLISLSPNSESENTSNISVVGSLSSNDPDAGEIEAFLLLDDAGGRFVQDGSVIRVANASLLDFENSASHQITVRVTDSVGHVLEQSLTINIIDFNFQPTDIGLSGNSVNEATISLLRSPDTSRPQGFGSSVAATDDRLLVSHRDPFSVFPYDGRVYLYDAATRSLIATLFNPTGVSGDQFGESIAIAGNYAVIGAGGNDSDGVDSGRAYVYDAVTGTILHVLQNPDQSAGNADDHFGSELSISGNVIAIHSRGDAIASLAGVVHLFDAVTGNLLTTISSPEPAENGHFGGAISMLNNRIVIGAPSSSITGTNSGRAYLYEFNSSTSTANLISAIENPTPEAFDRFGSSVVATSTMIAVAAPLDNTDADDGGHVYLFSSTSGALLRTLQAPVAADGDVFGISLAAIGDQIIVGSRHANGLVFSGQLHVYNATSGNLLAAIDNPAPDAFDQFGDLGQTIAINSSHIVVSAIGDDADGVNAGQVFLLDFPIGEVVGTLSAVDPEPGETFTFSLTDSAGGRFGIDGDNLIVADPALLNFEISATHDVTVQVTDSGGATFSETITIQVLNVAETSHILAGTVEDDDFVLTYSSGSFGGTVSVTVSTNGGAVIPVGTFPKSQTLTISGMAGNDSVLINATSDSDQFSALSEHTWMINGGFLKLSSIENRTVDLGAGNDGYHFMADSALGVIRLLENSGGTDRIDMSSTTSVGVSVNLSLTSLQTIHPANLQLQLQPANAFEELAGGAGNDELTGNAQANLIFGGRGSDTITGGGGSDVMFGGDGDDNYVFHTAATAEVDFLGELANEGTDSVSFVTLATTVTLNLSVTTSQVVHANRILQLGSSTAFENITGGSAGDILIGNAQNNQLHGRSGNDLLIGAAGSDSLYGGVGNDTYRFSDAADAEADFLVEYAGQGTDAVDFSQTTSSTVFNLNTNSLQSVHSNRTVQLNSHQFEHLFGGSGNDKLTGNSLNNLLIGGLGNDELIGLAGNDELRGEAGNDLLRNSHGGSDLLIGGAGDDSYVMQQVVFGAAIENDVIQELPGQGTDAISFLAAGVGVIMDLGQTSAQAVHTGRVLSLSSGDAIENLTGSQLGDILTGNSLSNVIIGANGDDILNGAGGNDELQGQLGNDTYLFDPAFQPESDFLIENFGQGTDTVNFAAVTDAVTFGLNSSGVWNTQTNRTVQLNAGNRFENLIGGSGNDTLTGNSLNNVISGGPGNDTLWALGGDDELHGQSGNDSLQDSHGGSDVLIGGTDDDIYVMRAVVAGAPVENDQILELFGEGTDHLGFHYSNAGTTVDLGLTVAQSVHAGRLLSLSANNVVEDVTGSQYSDVLSGNSLNNVIHGSGGNDILDGAAGNDVLRGSTGNDIYRLSPATSAEVDFLTEFNGSGMDLIDFSAILVDTVFQLNSNAVQAVHANRTLQLNSNSQFELIRGGMGSDILTGNALDNVIHGSHGNDVINGLQGRDILLGGDGADSIVGGTGEDILIAGSTPDEADIATWALRFSEVQTAWSVPSAAYGDRVTSLRTGVAASNSSLQAGVNVLNDANDIDTLTGETGDLDWHFAALNDIITDLIGGEFLDVL